MELMIDSINAEEITNALEYYPIKGITSNPTIIKKEGKIDFFTHFKKIQELLEDKASLHIQTTQTTCDKIVEEAKYLTSRLGREVFIKIPVTKEGLKAIGILSSEHYHITATAIYSSIQGILALLAGAEYLALYYNRMENAGIDASAVIKEIKNAIVSNNSNAKILGASFKNTAQVVSAISSGAHSVTIPYSVLEGFLANPLIETAETNFIKDWQSLYSDETILDFN
ncbi:MAG: fructose-6-phosphate aldolase [Spirochaetales bacterium]|nr:fructose-6-phosphate aldolase [Spirochaetales bacterium]